MKSTRAAKENQQFIISTVFSLHMRRDGFVSQRKNSIIFFPTTHTSEFIEEFMKVHRSACETRSEREHDGEGRRKSTSGKIIFSSFGKFFHIPSSVRELSSYSLERILVRILCALAVIVPV